MRVLVAVVLLAATAALLHVTVRTARAAGALAIGSCGAYGEAHDFRSLQEAERNALSKCKGDACRVVATELVERVGGVPGAVGEPTDAFGRQRG